MLGVPAQNEAITTLCREIIASWPKWEAEAGQQAQQDQCCHSYTDTLLGYLEDAIGRVFAQGARDFELMCLRLMRQLPEGNPVRKDAAGLIHRKGTGSILR